MSLARDRGYLAWAARGHAPHRPAPAGIRPLLQRGHADYSFGVQTGPARHAPSVINAVFNHRQFWDGRAQNVFNGVNGLGDLDPDAVVWRAEDPREPVPVRLRGGDVRPQHTADGALEITPAQRPRQHRRGAGGARGVPACADGPARAIPARAVRPPAALRPRRARRRRHRGRRRRHGSRCRSHGRDPRRRSRRRDAAAALPGGVTRAIAAGGRARPTRPTPCASGRGEGRESVRRPRSVARDLPPARCSSRRAPPGSAARPAMPRPGEDGS
jgi:hypothetical protein